MCHRKLKAKQIPIRQYLASIGYRPIKDSGHHLLYIAAYRGDTNPSLSVDVAANTAHDFGTGETMDVIALCQRIEGLSFLQALDRLAGNNFAAVTPLPTPAIPKLAPKSAIEIIEVKPLQNRGLLQYLAGRAISAETACKYLKEVYFRVNGGGRQYAIGFENDKGGYELRNPLWKGGTSPKTISTIPCGNPDTVYVTEGWADCLSLIGGYDIDGIVVCLNSTANLRKAEPLLAKCRTIYCALDGDDAGTATTKTILEKFPQAIDIRAEILDGHKDLNEKAIHKLKQL